MILAILKLKEEHDRTWTAGTLRKFIIKKTIIESAKLKNIHSKQRLFMTAGLSNIRWNHSQYSYFDIQHVARIQSNNLNCMWSSNMIQYFLHQMKHKTYYFNSLHFSIIKAVKEFGQNSNTSKNKEPGKSSRIQVGKMNVTKEYLSQSCSPFNSYCLPKQLA